MTSATVQAITPGVWLGPVLRFAFTGLAVGALLGLLGLAVTRWEIEDETVFYTPSRWLALFITLAIALRFVYGWWHATHSGASPDQQHWFLSAPATQLSLAVGAGLIGYYWSYAVGVRLRLRRHLQR